MISSGILLPEALGTRVLSFPFSNCTLHSAFHETRVQKGLNEWSQSLRSVGDIAGIKALCVVVIWKSMERWVGLKTKYRTAWSFWGGDKYYSNSSEIDKGFLGLWDRANDLAGKSKSQSQGPGCFSLLWSRSFQAGSPVILLAIWQGA